MASSHEKPKRNLEGGHKMELEQGRVAPQLFLPPTCFPPHLADQSTPERRKGIKLDNMTKRLMMYLII
jgi:hypothetical protein